jgi:hypothetical protein
MASYFAVKVGETQSLRFHNCRIHVFLGKYTHGTTNLVKIVRMDTYLRGGKIVKQ